MNRSEATLERVRGCLSGGAIGDALGANIEFDSLAAIRAAWGAAGVVGYVEGDYVAGSITDDTQMTLFSAEGLIRGVGSGDLVASVRRAYLRWLDTQADVVSPVPGDGWLVNQRVLHDRRAPGVTCMSALHSGGRGSVDVPLNDSKGCGTVMRAAPFGVLGSDEEAFSVSVACAALTHGHPSGYLAAGAFSVIVRRLLLGDGLSVGVSAALSLLGPASFATSPPRPRTG